MPGRSRKGAAFLKIVGGFTYRSNKICKPIKRDSFRVHSFNIKPTCIMKKMILATLLVAGSFSSHAQCSAGVSIFQNLPYGTLDSNKVIVKWSTASEEPSVDYFLVQRSTNGSDYTSIGYVDAVGTAVPHSYLFLDKCPNLSRIPTVRYRIAVVSIDQVYCFQSPVTIQSTTTRGCFSSPPSCGSLSISSSSNRVCSGSPVQFSVPSAPGPVTWSVNGGSVATLVPNSPSSATLSANGNSFLVLTANVTSAAGCVSNLTKTVMIGNALLENNGIANYTWGGGNGGGYGNLGTTNGFALSQGVTGSATITLNAISPFFSSITWSASTSTPGTPPISVSGNGTSGCYVSIGLGSNSWSNYGILNYVATPGCSGGSISGAIGWSVYKGSFKVFPTKTTGFITVDGGNSGTWPKSLIPKRGLIYEIRIVDKFGALMKVAKYSGGVPRTTVDLGALKMDTYFISIFDGTDWSSQQVIKY